MIYDGDVKFGDKVSSSVLKCQAVTYFGGGGGGTGGLPSPPESNILFILKQLRRG